MAKKTKPARTHQKKAVAPKREISPAAPRPRMKPSWGVYKKGTAEFVGVVFADTYFEARDLACAQFNKERGDIDIPPRAGWKNVVVLTDKQ